MSTEKSSIGIWTCSDWASSYPDGSEQLESLEFACTELESEPEHRADGDGTGDSRDAADV